MALVWKYLNDILAKWWNLCRKQMSKLWLATQLKISCDWMLDKCCANDFIRIAFNAINVNSIILFSWWIRQMLWFCLKYSPHNFYWISLYISVGVTHVSFDDSILKKNTHEMNGNTWLSVQHSFFFKLNSMKMVNIWVKF